MNRSSQSSCLNNKPNTTAYSTMVPLLGTEYSLDNQCVLLFGNNTKSCEKTVSNNCHVIYYRIIGLMFRIVVYFGVVQRTVYVIWVNIHLLLLVHLASFLIWVMEYVTKVIVRMKLWFQKWYTENGVNGVHGVNVLWHVVLEYSIVIGNVILPCKCYIEY